MINGLTWIEARDDIFPRAYVSLEALYQRRLPGVIQHGQALSLRLPHQLLRQLRIAYTSRRRGLSDAQARIYTGARATIERLARLLLWPLKGECEAYRRVPQPSRPP